MSAAGQAPVSSRTGVLWSTVNGGSAVVLPFLIFALFARMMSPHDLSLVMLAVALLEMLKAFGPQGVYDVVIRYPETDRQHYESAAAIFLISGLVLSLVFCGLIVLAPLVTKSDLPPILTVLSLKILFDYLAMQPQAVLARRMAFRRLGSRALTAGLISGVCGIGMAWATTPVLGLTAYYVVQSAVIFVMTSYNSGGALMRPRIDRSAMREMAGESTRASGVRLAAAANNYLDQLVLSAMVVPAALGLYNLGKRIEVVAITLTSSFGQMLFQPIFATAEPEERATHLGRGIAAITLVCGVPVVVLALYSKLAVPFVFGGQWAPAAPVVALLGISGLARAIGGVSGALFTVTGRNLQLLRISIAAGIVSVLIIVALAGWGVEAVAAGIMIRNIVLAWLQFVLVGDAAGQLPRLFLHNCFVPLAVVGIGAWLVGTGVALVLGVATPLAVFCVLAAAGLTAAGIGFAMLHNRM